MVEQWPEGPTADPEAARERYDSDMKATRKALREMVRADLPAAHFGLGTVGQALHHVQTLGRLRSGMSTVSWSC